MNSRERTRSSPPSDAPSPEEAFEVGTTTLDLDKISDQELESLQFEDETQRSRLLNLQTMSGLSLILAGLVYLLTELGTAPSSLLGLGTIIPWLVGASVILLGAGVLIWRSSRSSVRSSQPSPTPMPPNVESSNEDEKPTPSNRLVRSRTDKKLLGVCGGLADYLNLDPTLVRIAFVIGTIFFGSLLLVYVGLAIAMPKAPSSASNNRPTLPHDAPESD